MAIQEVEISSHGDGNTGFKREINEGARGLVLDTIQITQYTKPEESTVRELTANAVDSQREKEIAVSILSGQTTPEDHFIQREGAKYADSNWDPSYYDLKHLDQTKTNVELTYTQNEGVGYCDTFSVKDFGIGIGEARLEGYFQIGYSTKRNSKGSLGAFGFGNKVALSTRCDYYTVITVHNGKKYKFNCYSYKIDSTVGKFNLDTNEKNDFITFTNGTQVYFEKTNEQNYTEIIVPTKRHHRSKYEQAVKAQLLYFGNVEFNIIEEDGHVRSIDTAAEVLYSSSRLIVSKNNQFSKPHVVIVKGDDTKGEGTGVCYGYIDFPELEMEQLYGNVGIKCPIRSVIRDEVTGQETVLQEGVEVTPSRETVVWSEHTRDFIKKRFENAVEEATELVQDKLLETDFLRWLTTCKDVLMHTGQDSIMSELSRVVDLEGIRPKFAGTSIRYSNPSRMFRGFKTRFNSSQYDHKKNQTSIKRTSFGAWSEFSHERVYLKTSKTSAKKDAYIHSIAGNFLTVELMSDEELVKEYKENEVDSRNLSDKMFNDLKASIPVLWKAIEDSKDVLCYEDIEVPEDFGKVFEEQEEEGIKYAMSAKERRKIEAKIPIHSLTPKSNIGYSHEKKPKHFVWKQRDTKLIDVQEDTATIYYGCNKDDERLHFLGMILGAQYPDKWDQAQLDKQWGNPDDKYNYRFYNDEIKIIKINKTNERYFRGRANCIHVNNFFEQTTDIDG